MRLSEVSFALLKTAENDEFRLRIAGFRCKIQMRKGGTVLHDVQFTLGGMLFEYDEDKNQSNIRKHGISFRNAARVFFDYDRIELYDEENSLDEDRYDTIGDTSAGIMLGGSTVIGNADPTEDRINDILFVVYTEKDSIQENGQINVMGFICISYLAYLVCFIPDLH